MFCCCLQGGMYVFQMFDYYACNGACILFLCVFETLAMGWIFGRCAVFNGALQQFYIQFNSTILYSSLKAQLMALFIQLMASALRGAARDFGVHEKKSYWPPHSWPLGQQKFFILFYIKLCILMIFFTVIPIVVKRTT